MIESYEKKIEELNETITNLLKEKDQNKKRDFIRENKNRRSIYRGVSKNGNKWQVIVYSKYLNGYIGVYPTQELAARVYDIYSIKNKGLKANTNFMYNLHQIQANPLFALLHYRL